MERPIDSSVAAERPEEHLKNGLMVLIAAIAHERERHGDPCCITDDLLAVQHRIEQALAVMERP